MGRAIEVIGGRAVAPGAVMTAVTVNAGDSLAVRYAKEGTPIWLLSAWVKSQGSGLLQVRSPQLHDNVRGIRVGHVVAQVYPLVPQRLLQPLVSQDQLTVELTGSAVAGDFELAELLIYYEDLIGVQGRFIGLEELRARVEDYEVVENTITTGAGGGYTGAEAINAEQDLMYANTDYALVGYLCQAINGTIRWRGVDTGNVGVGGPGNALDKDLTRAWFIDLAETTGLPCIPVFNSANKAGILIDCQQDENAAAVLVSSIFARLRAG
jgi:hypothetical protein